MESRIRLICSECGSTDVGRDAWAEWNEKLQMFEATHIFKQGHCFNCEGETQINEENIDEQ